MTPFEKQQREAKRHIDKLKKNAPYLFHQYQRYMQAKDALERAQSDYERAKRAWEEL